MNTIISQVMLKMSNLDWTPLIYILYHGDLFQLEWVDDQMTADFRFFLKSSYFNNAKGTWEPILEKSYLALSHEGPVTGDGLQQIGITSEFKDESVNSLDLSEVIFFKKSLLGKKISENYYYSLKRFIIGRFLFYLRFHRASVLGVPLKHISCEENIDIHKFNFNVYVVSTEIDRKDKFWRFCFNHFNGIFLQFALEAYIRYLH